MNAWLAWSVAGAASALVALDVARVALARRRHARQVNRGLVRATLPSLDGPLRDAACGALVGAALGDALGRRAARWPRWIARRRHVSAGLTRLPRALHYGIRTQLMLTAARAVDPGSALNTRRYRLELAYLARYAAPDTPWALERLAARLRRSPIERDVASARHLGPEILNVAIPLGLAMHDRPAHAARAAATLVRHTHRRDEVTQSAALVASAVAHAVQAYGRQEKMTLSPRRHWLGKVITDAGGPETPAAIAVLAAADLAAEPLGSVVDRLRLEPTALDVLVLALQVALHRTIDPAGDARGAIADALALGPLAPGVASLALALIGARTGLTALRATLGEVIERVQDEADIELHGEKLALVRPVDERAGARALPAPRR